MYFSQNIRQLELWGLWPPCSSACGGHGGPSGPLFLSFLSFCLFSFLSFCPFAFLHFCLFVFLSFCLFAFLSFCLFVFVSDLSVVLLCYTLLLVNLTAGLRIAMGLGRGERAGLLPGGEGRQGLVPASCLPPPPPPLPTPSG